VSRFAVVVRPVVPGGGAMIKRRNGAIPGVRFPRGRWPHVCIRKRAHRVCRSALIAEMRSPRNRLRRSIIENPPFAFAKDEPPDVNLRNLRTKSASLALSRQAQDGSGYCVLRIDLNRLLQQCPGAGKLTGDLCGARLPDQAGRRNECCLSRVERRTGLRRKPVGSEKHLDVVVFRAAPLFLGGRIRRKVQDGTVPRADRGIRQKA